VKASGKTAVVAFATVVFLTVPFALWGEPGQTSPAEGHGGTHAPGAMPIDHAMSMNQMIEEMHSLTGVMSGMMGGMAGTQTMGMGQHQTMMGQQQGMEIHQGQGTGMMNGAGPMMGMTRSMNGLTGSMNDVMEQMQDIMNDRQLMQNPEFARGIKQMQEHMGMMMQGFDGMVHNLQDIHAQGQKQP
jgi:hypothetical protein